MENYEEEKVESLKDGFRVGDFFVTFPDHDFVKEDKDGEMFIEVEIYKIDRDRVFKTKEGLTPEIERAIQEELMRMLKEGLDLVEKDYNVKD